MNAAGDELGQVSVSIYELGEPIPPALRTSKENVPAQLKEKLKRLGKRDPVRFLTQLATAWTLIILAIYVASVSDSWIVSAFVVAFVATRQNVLALLMHEQCHRLGFLSTAGDVFTNLTICYPLTLPLEDYRRIHLAHHQNYFTDRDPDYLRKQGQEWTFPQKLSFLLKSFLTDLLGLNFIRLLRGKGVLKKKENGAGKENDVTLARNALHSTIRIAFYVAAVILITYFHVWTHVLLYWLLPLLTVFQVIIRWGAICEHRYNLIHPTVTESTPLIIPRWWESLLLPNLNFTFHTYHHWYPRIPYAKLPLVHRMFQAEGLVNEQHVFQGYVSYLQYILGAQRKPAGATSKTRVAESSLRFPLSERQALPG